MSLASPRLQSPPAAPGSDPAAQRPLDASARGPFRPGELTPTRTRLLGRMISVAVRALDILVAGLLLALALQTALWPVLVMGGALLLIGLTVTGGYRFAPQERLPRHLFRIVLAFTLPAAALGLYALANGDPLATSALSHWLYQAFAALLVIHIGAWSLVRRWRRKGLLTPTVVIVGATPGAERLIQEALKSGDVAVLGVFDDRKDRLAPNLSGVPVLGDTAALLTHRIMPCVDRVVITVAPAARSRVSALVDRLSVLPNAVSLLLEDGSTDGGESLSRISGLTLANMSGAADDDARALIKRLMDVSITALGLLVAAPVMLTIALAVKLDSPGPVFFRQRRHGFNNEAIHVWKFRSMRNETADATASRQISVDDDRVTRVGRFIRRTSLDELPQLFNVLTGEMSLVGPRPHAIGMKTGDTESAKLVAHYAHRHRMKPGLTGWAAIRGSRGPVDTPEAVRRRVALDVEYIERQSLWLDLYIVVMTLPCLMGDDDVVR